MPFDILLPSVLFFLTAASVFLYPKLEAKIKGLLEERKFRMRDVALLVIVMSIAVTVYVLIPTYAIMAIFLFFYSIALFTFIYSATSKWYIALILPAIFLLLYFFFWGIPQIDLFAAIFVVFVSVYIGTFFEWKTLAVFAGLLTIMDIIQVLVTGFMVESSLKMVNLKLPVMIIAPTFPYQSTYLSALGLGDVLLSSLLAIQTAKKYGKKFGYVSIAFMAASFLIFWFLMLYYKTGGMPATVFIVFGWLVALGVRQIYNWLTSKKRLGE